MTSLTTLITTIILFRTLGDVLQLDEYLKNCTTTSQTDTKRSDYSTRSKDLYLSNNFRTGCFMLLSLYVF